MHINVIPMFQRNFAYTRGGISPIILYHPRVEYLYRIRSASADHGWYLGLDE
jgi:hypothetical protein